MIKAIQKGVQNLQPQKATTEGFCPTIKSLLPKETLTKFQQNIGRDDISISMRKKPEFADMNVIEILAKVAGNKENHPRPERTVGISLAENIGTALEKIFGTPENAKNTLIGM